MDKCPACGSTRVYPSRHRSTGERLHQIFTEKRPYRCHECGWRAWASIEVHIPPQPDIDPQSLGRPHAERPLASEEMDSLDLPGAERIGAPKDAGRPLATEQLDPLDPKES